MATPTERAVMRSALLITSAVLASRLWFIFHRAFDVDEIEHMHATWCVSRGLVPYRDFFEHHTPALYLLVNPLFHLFATDTDPHAATSLMITARLLMWPPLIATIALVYHFAAAWRDRTTGAIAAILLVGLGVMFTQKVLFAFPGVAMALMLELPRRRGHVLAFAAGIALPIATVAWFFAARGALDPFIYYTVQLNVRLIADRFPPLPRLLANILNGPAVFLLGAGIFIIGRSYDQYYALLLPLLAVLGAGFVRDRVHAFTPAWIARPAYAPNRGDAVVDGVLGCQPDARVYQSNDEQRAGVAFVTAHTNASDSYVGGSPGPALFRPNAWFYFFLTGPFADDRAFADLQAAVDAGRPRLVLMDPTFRASPPAILAAVQQRYAPVRGIIWDRRATDSTRDPSRSNTTRQ